MKYVRIFCGISIFFLASLIAIGFQINNFGIEFLIFNKMIILVICSLFLIIYLTVSYSAVGEVKFVYLVVIAVLTIFLIGVRLKENLVLDLEYFTEKRSFTYSEADLWQVQGSIKPGDTLNRLIVCKLSDMKICLSYKYRNMLIYRPYQLCNIKGKLFYKEINSIRSYDLYNNTLLEGDYISIRCFDTWISKLFEVRDSVILKIHQKIPRPQSSLLSGIIFGVDQYYSKDFSSSIQSAGISHIVAASGYNVSILVLGLERFTKYLPEKFGYVIKIFFIWLYALLTGFSSSMVRASSMASVGYIAKLFNLKVEIKDIFLITISIFVLINPLIAFDLGFLLSVASTFGVIFYVSVLEKMIPLKWFPFATFACTLVTLPFTIINFNTLAPYSIIANLLILPVIESVMILGLLGLIFEPVIYISWGILKYVEWVANWFGNLPYAIIEISEISSILVSILLFLFIYISTYIYGSKSSDSNN